MRSKAFFLTLMFCLSISTGFFFDSSHESNLLDVDDMSPSDSKSSTDTSSWIVSPSNGWTTGSEEITITGSGFSDIAFSNTTDDGINHQWVESTMDYTDEAGRYNSIVMDSNGHLHAVHISGGNYQIRHSIHDGNSWN